MGLLLYKSNEMFSSTELIRKSKMIFNKILDKTIDKAIILRDGKPSFLLMEFKKYENIMSEFEELKLYVEKHKNKSINKKTKEKKIKEEIKIIPQVESVESVEIKETIDTPKFIDTSAVTVNIIKEEPKAIQKDDNIIEKQNEDISEDDEIKNALKSIESMNFDENMKKAAQEKIKEKILQQRNLRAKELELQKKEEEENRLLQEQEEAELLQQIEEEKAKKQRELEEFWD